MTLLPTIILFFVVTVGCDYLAMRFGLKSDPKKALIQSLTCNNITLIILPFLAMPFSVVAESSPVVHFVLFSPPAWLLQSLFLEMHALKLLWNIPYAKSYVAVAIGNLSGFLLIYVGYDQLIRLL